MAAGASIGALLEPGTVVAGHSVESVLGQGGMGVVYEAVQLSLNRTVALKVLAPRLSEDEVFRERFRREGLLQAGLDHPHIVTVYEAGESDYGLFLAMQLVRGPRLRDLIRSHELDAARTIGILAPVAEALDAAHDAGLIHRDVKPQNILIGARDHAYLADFGLTKLPGDRSLTQSGEFVGTLDYVAPEQILGEPAGAPSDFYALAAVLHECLTGAVPYQRETNAALLYAHLSDRPPKVTDRVPELPAALDEVIAKGMAKDPAERHPSAAALVDDVQRAFGDGAPPDVRPPVPESVRGRAEAPTVHDASAARRWDARRLAAIGAVLFAVAIGAGLLVGDLGPDDPAGSRSASSGAVRLAFPEGWRAVDAGQEIPGLALSDAVQVAPRRTAAEEGLVAGRVVEPGASLLPNDLLARLGRRPDPPDPVRLGDLDAYRYTDLRPTGFNRRLSLYLVPTQDDVVAAACSAVPERADSFLPNCGRVAATIGLVGADAEAVAPSDDYADAANRVFRALNPARRAGRVRLSGAKTRDGQARSAATLASAFDRARRNLAEVSPPAVARLAHESVVVGLRFAADAYSRLSGAVRAGDGGRFESAAARVRRGETAVQRGLDALKALGYSIG